jgi:hypothetical protein
MTLEQLQNLYHGKIVRVKSFYKFPEVDYTVTAVVENGDGYVWAIRDINYTIETKRWYTIFCDNLEQLNEVVTHFEIING